MTIIQPRLDSISTDEITVEELIKWAEEVLKANSQNLHLKVKVNFVQEITADSVEQKQFVKLELIRIWNLLSMSFRTPNTLDYEDIAFILGRADELSKWAKDVQEYASRTSSRR